MGNACTGPLSTVVLGVPDLKELIFEWMGRPKNELSIDWSGVEFKPESPPKYNAESSRPSESTVLHSATFTNKMSSPQTFQMTVDKKVLHSSCEVNLTQAFNRDGKLLVPLKVPPQVARANFPELEVSSMRQKFDQEYAHSTTQPVVVPPRTRAHVTVVSKEEMYESNFSYMMRVKGTVVVREYKDGTLKSRKQSNMREILVKLRNENGIHVEGVQYGDKFITLPIKGKCRFQYVVNTEVQLQESELHDEYDC